MPLRPLLFGEILDGSFQTIRRNAAAMLGAALLAQTLATVVGEAFTANAESRGESIGLWLAGLAPPEAAGLGVGPVIGAALLLLVSFFISTVLQGVMVVPVARSVLNRRTGFKEMWRLSRARVGSLIVLGGMQILTGVTIVVVLVGGTFLLADAMRGMSALILVPLFLGTAATVVLVSVRLAVTPAVIVVEELGVVDGVRRSWHLTRHNWWRIFGIVLVTTLLVGVISQIVLIPLELASEGFSSVIAPHGGGGERALDTALGIATIIAAALIAAVGYAFQTSVMGLLYMDLRMRKEGLDLALQRQLESDKDSDGVPGRGVAPEANIGGRPPFTDWPRSPYGPQPPYGPPPRYGTPPSYGAQPPYGPPQYGPPPGYRPPPGAG